MAVLTVTFTAENATRIAAAFQETLDLEQPATATEVEQYVKEKIKQVVRASEKRVAEAAANPNPADVVFD